MKTAADVYALAAVANAHYTFPSLIADGKTTPTWKYARNGLGIIAMAPSPTCQAEATAANVDAATKSAAWKMTVAPGSKIRFVTNQVITQIGVMEWYMAKVPAGHTATPWDESGNVWFKINVDHPTFSPLNWPSSGMYFFLLDSILVES